MMNLVFHVDVNSAYLSWEAVKRISEGKEDIRLIPSIIGGDKDKRHGVVLAKSIPAKKFGIKTGEPIVKALQKCPDLFIAKPDHRLYDEFSAKFIDVCRQFSPVVEQFSVDECFLDMSNMERIFPDPIEAAYKLKDTIKSTLGFTVNVGISTNKVLAKMASDFEKPDKVHTLFPEEIEQKMWHLPVRELFLVGASTAAKLESANILTIGDLANYDAYALKTLLGTKFAYQLHDYANGIDTSSVLSEPEEAKGYSISTTLEKDITSIDEANKVLLYLCDNVTARIRADKVQTMCISVSIRTNKFKNSSHQKKLLEPTDITSEIYDIAKALFVQLWDKRTPLRLLGVSLTHITKEQFSQISFLDDNKKEKHRKLDKAIDSIRNKYGSDKITRAAIYNKENDLDDNF